MSVTAAPRPPAIKAVSMAAIPARPVAIWSKAPPRRASATTFSGHRPKLRCRLLHLLPDRRFAEPARHSEHRSFRPERPRLPARLVVVGDYLRQDPDRSHGSTDPTTPGGDGDGGGDGNGGGNNNGGTGNGGDGSGEGTATAGAMVAATVTAAARAAMATAPATRRKRTAPPAPKALAANSRNPRPAPGMTPSPPGKRRSRTPRKNSRPR